ncbi:MAG: DNA-binding transcriptional regulator [Phycisphaeraceae bacterium]|nr:DNA-binding transcriptional regulator [Phycisphaeraceae bacterium]
MKPVATDNETKAAQVVAQAIPYPELKRVVVMVPQGYTSTGKIMRGIFHYARPHRPWTFRLKAYVDDLEIVNAWQPHGIIAYPFNEEQIVALQSLNVPVICVSERCNHPGLVTVATDGAEAGRLAARHLMDRGYRHFRVMADQTNIVSWRRKIAFEQELKYLGFDCEVFDLSDQSASGRSLAGLTGFDVDRRIIEWLLELPKPCGVFCWHDTLLPRVMESCHESGLNIPNQIALIGVDNDETFCEICFPAASSVAMPFEQVGYKIGEILDQLMNGDPPPVEPILIPPRHVVARQSTEGLAVTDPLVREATSFIRNHCHEPITIDTVLSQLGTSRRSLENHFREALGRTPLQELHRIRVERAQKFLAQSNLTLKAIAQACGFRSVKRLNAVFEKWTGVTAAEFRRAVRPGN